MTSKPITNTDDYIDSRDVIARIAELRQDWADATGDDPDLYQLSSDDYKAGLTDDEAEELAALEQFAKDGSDYSDDWEYGAQFIRDTYFEEYARELADDIGAIPTEYSWPTSCIDWEQAARELRMDYTAVDFDGVTYWVR